MAADLPRSGVVMSVSGSVSGGKVSKLKLDRFWLPALPPRAEVRAAAADSFLLAVACLVSYWLTTRVLSLVYSVCKDDDALAGMWSLIATCSCSGTAMTRAWPRPCRGWRRRW